MIKDESGSEELIMGLGAILASAILLLVVFSLFRSTLPADRSVALQFCASDISGDIVTVASSSVPYSHTGQYSLNGISISVSSDFVTAEDQSGGCFAKPLPVRVNPGRYSCGSVSWDGTAEFREYLNATFGAFGSEQSPVDSCNASGICDLLAAARRDLAANPLVIDESGQLVVEKELIYVRSDSRPAMECIPCVFVYER